MTRTLPDLLIEPVVRMALAEDLGRVGDVTAQACIPEGARFSAVFAAPSPAHSSLLVNKPLSGTAVFSL